MSKNSVAQAYESIQCSPEIKEPFEELDLTANMLTVKLGTAIFENPKVLIRVDDLDLLSIADPLDGSSFPTLNGQFLDHNGNKIFELQDNAWFGSLDLWDIEITGRKATFRTGPSHVALEFILHPPNELEVTQLDMRYGESHIVCNSEALLVGRIKNGKGKYIGIGRVQAMNAETAIDVRTTDAEFGYRGLSIVGGEGIELQGAGIRIGVGSQSMTVSDITIWEV